MNASTAARRARPRAVPERRLAAGRGADRGRSGISAIACRVEPEHVVRPVRDGDRPLGVVAQREARDAERGRLLLDAARVGHDGRRPASSERKRPYGCGSTRWTRRAAEPSRSIAGARVRGCTGKTTGRCSATARARAWWREEGRRVDERRPVERHEHVARRLDAEVLHASELPRRVHVREQRVDHRVADEADPRRGDPSRARFSCASGECVSSSDERWSVSRRLCSSGIDQSKLRSPASRWQTGDAELHRRERAGERRVDVARHDHEVGPQVDERLLEPRERPRRLLAVRARADLELDVGPGSGSSSKKTSLTAAS